MADAVLEYRVPVWVFIEGGTVVSVRVDDQHNPRRSEVVLVESSGYSAEEAYDVAFDGDELWPAWRFGL